MTIEFTVPGIPKAQPRPRSFALRGKGGRPVLDSRGQPIIRAYESGTAEAWKSAIAIAAMPFVPESPLEGPVAVDITFTFPRPAIHRRSNGKLKDWAPAYHTGKPDRDNLDKAVLDTLTTIGMWRDDGQVCAGRTTKLYGDKPGATIWITPFAGPVRKVITEEQPPLCLSSNSTAAS